MADFIVVKELPGGGFKYYAGWHGKLWKCEPFHESPHPYQAHLFKSMKAAQARAAKLQEFGKWRAVCCPVFKEPIFKE